MLNMENIKQQKAEQASVDAIIQTKLSQEAIENARLAQVELSEERHFEMMVRALKTVFPDNDNQSDKEMQIYLPRIPLLCQQVLSMKTSIEKIDDNIAWVVRIIIGAVILALLTLIFK